MPADDLPLSAADHRGGCLVQPALAPFGVQLPLTVTQEQVTYFATPHAADFQPERFPIWIWMDDPCFYGFPVFGEAGPKAGQDAGGREVTAETRTLRARPGGAARVARLSRRSTSPARWVRSSTPRPASTRSRRTATSCSTRCPDHPDVSSRSAAGTDSSSPR